MSKHLSFGATIVMALVLVGTVGVWNLPREASAAREKWEAPKEATELKNPLSHTDETVAAGEKIYEKNCAPCHGPRGRGRGPAAVALDPKPRPFRNPEVASQPDGALFWKISKGRAPMPAWERSLSKEERWEVIHYLHTFTGKAPNASRQLGGKEGKR